MKDCFDYQKDKKIERYYIDSIITNQNNKLMIKFENKESKIDISCHYYKDYSKIEFINSYAFEELQEMSNFYRQFNNIGEIIRELNHNRINLENKCFIKGNEDISDEIILNINLNNYNIQFIFFILKKVKKNQKEIFDEMKNIINIYLDKTKIKNFSSSILVSKEDEKRAIKFWISPNEKLSSKLLYSYNIHYTSDPHNNNNYIYNFNGTVKDFHRQCDNKNRILMICKSKNEIFGGYTPLSFSKENDYGNDNHSFLFSLTRLEKYPKDSFDRTKSIWKYKNYGPSFHYDLYFKENKMNIIKFDKTNYLTPNNWVNRNNCFFNDDGILLEALEIFQIYYNEHIDIEDNLINFKYMDINDNSPYNNKKKNIKSNINNKINIIGEDKINENEINDKKNDFYKNKEYFNKKNDKEKIKDKGNKENNKKISKLKPNEDNFQKDNDKYGKNNNNENINKGKDYINEKNINNINNNKKNDNNNIIKEKKLSNNINKIKNNINENSLYNDKKIKDKIDIKYNKDNNNNKEDDDILLKDNIIFNDEDKNLSNTKELKIPENYENDSSDSSENEDKKSSGKTKFLNFKTIIIIVIEFIIVIL